MLGIVADVFVPESEDVLLASIYAPNFSALPLIAAFLNWNF